MFNTTGQIIITMKIDLLFSTERGCAAGTDLQWFNTSRGENKVCLVCPQTVFIVSLYSVGTHALFSIGSSLVSSHAHCAFPRKPFSKENTPHSQLSASISFLKIPRIDLMSFLPVFFIWCVLCLAAAEDQTYALTVCHKRK